MPLVEFQDYYKNGIWQNDLMRLDIEVIDAHRKEAGAPDVPPLEELEFPELPPPVQVPAVQPLVRPAGVPGTPAAAAAEALARLAAQQQAAGLPAPVTGAAAAVVVPPATGALPVTVPPVTVPVPGQSAMPAPKAVVVPVPSPAAAGTVPAVVVPPLVAPLAPVVPPRPLEHKDIALFVSTWKLDPNKAKAALEKITPARRRFVMQNFKGATNGASPAEKLEEYVAECEKSGAWDGDGSASATPAAGPSAGTDAAGVKRPLDQAPEDPSKRQNTSVVTSKAASKAATVMSKAGTPIKLD